MSLSRTTPRTPAKFPGLRVVEVLSDKLEPVSGFWKHCALAGKKLPPLRKCGGAVLLEILSAVEMAFLVVVD